MARKLQPLEIPLSRKLWVSLLVLIALMIVGSFIAAMFGTGSDDVGANVAHIRVVGPIMGDAGSGLFAEQVVSSTETVRQLHKAAEDKSIKAVLIEINSPGGSAVASDEIGQAIHAVRAEGKPVVAWIREVGASGGYWVASASDHVIANRMSITGSIGVYGSYLGFSEFIEEWNVTHNRLVAGEMKDVGDPFEELGPREKAYLQGKLDRIHGFFLDEIGRNRNLTEGQIEAVSDGAFYLGVEALDLGLIDDLGGKQEALEWIGNQTGIVPKMKVYEKERGFLESLLVQNPGDEIALQHEWWIPELR